jgi:hypothetical protein
MESNSIKPLIELIFTKLEAKSLNIPMPNSKIQLSRFKRLVPSSEDKGKFAPEGAANVGGKLPPFPPKSDFKSKLIP